MPLRRKNPKADLKRSYTLFLEVGLIVTLLVMLVVFKMNLYSAPPEPMEVFQQEEVVMEEVIQTKQIETPPPPPRPPVPVEVPNDEIIEDDFISLDAELTLDGPIDLPPPPPPAAEAEEPEEDFFVVVEQMPELIGGLAGLQKRVKYPEMARRAGIEGRVTIQFIVNEKGQIENPRVIRGIGGGCDEAALDALKGIKFKPGMQRGRPVRVQYSLPVVFKLQN